MRFYNVRDLRAAGVFIESYKGPGLEVGWRGRLGWACGGAAAVTVQCVMLQRWKPSLHFYFALVVGSGGLRCSSWAIWLTSAPTSHQAGCCCMR